MNGGSKSGLDLRSVLDRAAQVRVQNALNPLLWLSAVAPPVCFLFAWLAGFEGPIAGILVAAGVLPVLATVAALPISRFGRPIGYNRKPICCDSRNFLS